MPRQLRERLASDAFANVTTSPPTNFEQSGVGIVAEPTWTTFENKGNVAIQAGQQIVHGGININQNGPDMLKQIPFAAQAAFNSYDKQHDRICLPDTRVDVLEQIMAWADGHDERCIFWLNGMAGTGKSTIARTVARAYYEQERLGASFFFSRGGGDVSHAGKFFASIAVQLANKSPPLKRYICEAIAAHSDIASQAFRDQWIHLILRPLSKLAADSLQPPLILVVDALDECEGEDDIRKILQLLAEARALKTVRLRIFITSRPEIPIRHGFYDIPEAEHQDFVLHNISPSIIEHDISIFLKSELEAIRREHTLPSGWPGERVIELFVQSAGGLFIYAATACRFLRDPKWLPEDRLPLVLQGHTTDKSPTQQLDNIYAQVLQHSVIGDCDGPDKEMLSGRFRQIVGSIVILYDPLSAIALSRLLNVRHRITDVTLSPLYSVLRVPDSLNSSVRLLHPSFRDFLLDQKRCRDQHFWVDEKKAHEALAENCLRLMFNCLRRDICGLRAPGTFANAVESSRIEQYLPPDLRYACRYWVQHFQRSEARLVDDCQIHKFLRKHFLHWLEALSLIGKTSEGVLMVKVLQSMINPSENPKLFGLIYDANRFVLSNRSVIEMVPLQTYCSALVFSPKMSEIRRQFGDQIPPWVTRLPAVRDDWNSLLQALEGHSGRVNAVVFSPDGQMVASASEDCTVRLWDAGTGASRDTLEDHSSGINAVEFSPDGQMVASASKDGTVRLWDTGTGASRGTLEGHSGWVHAVAFSPDGQMVASASGDGTVRLWDTGTGASRDTLKGYSREVHAVVFSPDGQTVASASSDYTVRLWDVGTGALRSTLEGHSSGISAVAFSPDGQMVASASEDSTVRLWDTGTGASRGTLKGHSSWVNAVAFSPDDQMVASASWDRTVRLWDARTGASRDTLEGHSNWVSAVVFSPDGQVVASASGDGTVRLWDAGTGALRGTLEGHSGGVNAVVFSPDGQIVASASNDHTVRLWDTGTGVSRGTLESHSREVYAMEFSPDGQMVASASGDHTVRLWDAGTGASCGTLEGHSGWAHTMAFSPDGQMVASASWDRIVRLWDAGTGVSRGTLEGHSNRVNAVAFSPDGQMVASASWDRTVRLWDIETGAPRGTLEGHSYGVNAVAFSPDGQMVASASDDGTVRLWDSKTGASRSTLNGHSGEVHVVAFSTDGQMVASASWNGTVRLWDTGTGASRGTLEGHSGRVNAVAFSPDGQMVASASDDRTVRLWDAGTRETIKELNIYAVVRQLSFASDGFHLVTDRGALDIGLSLACQRGSPSGSSFALYVSNEWVTWKTKEVLWLHPDYRGSCVAVRDNVLVIGHMSGQVTFIELDPDTLSLSI